MAPSRAVGVQVRFLPYDERPGTYRHRAGGSWCGARCPNCGHLLVPMLALDTRDPLLRPFLLP